MTGNTLVFYRGSSFEYQGQFQTDDGTIQSLVGITPTIHDTFGAGMQDLEITVLDAPLGRFFIRLHEDEGKKLPIGRSSWFQIGFQWDGSPSAMVFPKIWLDAR